MDAKKYLQQVRKLNVLIEQKRKQVKNLKEFAESITVPMDKERVSSSPTSLDKIGEIVAKIIDLENEINCDIDKYIELKKEVIGVIDSVEDARLMNLLYERYLNFKTWDNIAAGMGITYQWVHILHKIALKNVQKLVD